MVEMKSPSTDTDVTKSRADAAAAGERLGGGDRATQCRVS
jgi:hypothetical protein